MHPVVLALACRVVAMSNIAEGHRFPEKFAVVEKIGSQYKWLAVCAAYEDAKSIYWEKLLDNPSPFRGLYLMKLDMVLVDPSGGTNPELYLNDPDQV